MENDAWESSRFREAMQLGDKLVPQNILEAVPSSTSVLSVLWELKSQIAFGFNNRKLLLLRANAYHLICFLASAL